MGRGGNKDYQNQRGSIPGGTYASAFRRYQQIAADRQRKILDQDLAAMKRAIAASSPYEPPVFKRRGSTVITTTVGQNFAQYFQLKPPFPLGRNQPSINQQEQDPMANKFKQGDRVTYTKKNTTLTDKVGTVLKYDGGSFYLIEYDEMVVGLHNCDGAVPSGRGYFNDVADLELIKEPAKTVVNFDSVIISEEKRQQILEALEQVNKEELIFETWGFKDTIEKGRGVGLLFYGEPGTGKTLMGQAIAHKLERKLKIIGTADIESSKPGEAERNIRKYFEEAKKENSILLFDECDSLIFSRQGVGPILSAQINELLSQIERFQGVTIFTTNRLGTLDEAVNRRLALKLHFELPTQAERVEIWKRMIPKKAPIAKDVSWDKLSVVEITGGYIKNTVLRAARMAATEDKPDKDKLITHKHFVKALTLETNAMLEFKKAREEHTRGVGVARHVGGRTIVTGNDKDAA